MVVCGILDSDPKLNKNFEGWQGLVGICVDKIDKIFSYKREDQEIRKLAGPATMTSRAYKSEGEKVNYPKKGGRKEKREGEKAGPATMTSRAYKIKKKGGGRCG